MRAATTTAAAPSAVPLVALALGFLGLAIGTELARERVVPRLPDPLPTLWMRSPAAMDRVALSFDDVAADLYWIRAVVYYGSERRTVDRPRNYDLLYPLLDLTTTLDPRFLLAYRMGAIFLSEPYPGGAGRPDLAIALLEKGVRYDANRWQLLHDIGFVYFWSHRDYRHAAEWLRRAAAVEGAPAWLQSTAAGMLARGGERDTARALWQEMFASDNETMRNHARMRLQQLDALDQIDALHSLIARVTLATGRRPVVWSDLIAHGWLHGVPVDPTGTPYVIDPGTGQVSVSQQSGIYPLPDYSARR